MNFSKIIKLDEAITEIELAQERAFVVSDNLSQSYFGFAIPKILDLQVYYNDARIKSDIIRDYLNDIEEGLHEIRNCLQAIEKDYKDGEREESGMKKEKVFTNEELKAIYSNFLDSVDEPAPDSVRDAYFNLKHAFEAYLCAVEEYQFGRAFLFAKSSSNSGEGRQQDDVSER